MDNPMLPTPFITPKKLDELTHSLRHQPKVKLAGIDSDGVLRGKLISVEKFLSTVRSGGTLGWCSVIFGWDMHDRTYKPELSISNSQNGYRDLIARIDLSSQRLIPWENVPIFLVDFFDPLNENAPLCACPRGLLQRVLANLNDHAHMVALAGIEYEYFQFKETPQSIKDKHFVNLTPLTVGMHGYSLLRPGLNQEYYHELFDQSRAFGIPIEGHHTETGPGVYETALAYTDALQMADNATLFKLTAKNVGMKHGIIPSFMAKPHSELPGCSGHVHISLWSIDKKVNLFAGRPVDPSWPEHTSEISPMAEQFIAGLMMCLPDIIPCLIPTINGYKRLVEGFWAATHVSWGLDSRLASIRIIAPPNCDPKATRLEIRVPGADMNPHYALAALLSAGYYGIKNNLCLKDFPPVSNAAPSDQTGGMIALPTTLHDAAQRFMKADSKARELLGDEFVDFFGHTRVNEWKLYTQAVTNWEIERYLELA